jgi:AcrR family transcriptional regulator
MAARDAGHRPPETDPASSIGNGRPPANGGRSDRYRPLPTGTHGLDPELVKRDQRERLQQAMIELIADKGYPAVRIVDLVKLAHVSQPTFYKLYAGKEDLFLRAYDEVAARAAATVIGAYDADGSQQERVIAAMRAFAELAAAEPEPMSLLVLGAFGAGTRALRRRRRVLEEIEQSVLRGRPSLTASGAGGTEAAADADDDIDADSADLTVKAILGGIRDVTAARLREGRASELPGLTDELARWVYCYPARPPAALGVDGAAGGGAPTGASAGAAHGSARARRAEGRLPSGRSDLPRQFIVKSQRERIVDATAAIVAEKGLAALTVPEIARRANVSNQTFYDIYASKHEAFLGAQKVGMHQALRVAVEAYQAHADDWPRAVGAGARALVKYLVSEPAHAHLTLVDTFAACPEAIEIRNTAMSAFASYLAPGYELTGGAEVPPIAAEAIAGGVWQIFYHYIEHDRIDELCATVPQLTYFALTPFLGPADAAAYAVLDSA